MSSYKTPCLPYNDLLIPDLALHLIHSYQVLGPEHNAAEGSPALDSMSIKRECARRAFWCVLLIEVLWSLFTGRAVSYNREDLVGYQLPCDEATFEIQRAIGIGELLSIFGRADVLTVSSR